MEKIEVEIIQLPQMTVEELMDRINRMKKQNTVGVDRIKVRRGKVIGTE